MLGRLGQPGLWVAEGFDPRIPHTVEFETEHVQTLTFNLCRECVTYNVQGSMALATLTVLISLSVAPHHPLRARLCLVPR